MKTRVLVCFFVVVTLWVNAALGQNEVLLALSQHDVEDTYLVTNPPCGSEMNQALHHCHFCVHGLGIIISFDPMLPIEKESVSLVTSVLFSSFLNSPPTKPPKILS